MFDAALCIAVMHHLASRGMSLRFIPLGTTHLPYPAARRLAVIAELLRITSPEGFVMIHAWAQVWSIFHYHLVITITHPLSRLVRR